MDHPIILGVAAMDRKARSKPMQNILNRMLANKDLDIQIIIFGDKALVDDPPSAWPIVDVLISFFSTGFPLEKAIAYVDLRKPVLVNDLRLQKVLWDRRLVLSILDSIKVLTPRRQEVNRDGGPFGPLEPQIADDLQSRLGIKTSKLLNMPAEECRLKDGDTDVLIIGSGKDAREIRKPFVEKPVSGEDHNIHIYFPRSKGGGGRRLFRKVGNKSSEFDPDLTNPRMEGSYIYEEFMDVDNAEDIKIYTIGPHFVHAETRKSPVVDGLVKRNPEGKEIRYIIKLTEEEVRMATAISKAFKQNICGFDLLRVGKKSYVIDVNGWSFVKGNDFYYDKCAEILGKFIKNNAATGPHMRAAAAAMAAGLTIDVSGASRALGSDIAPAASAVQIGGANRGRPGGAGGEASSSSASALAEGAGATVEPGLSEQSSWQLKANVTVFRHGDRTPKQKLKRSFKPKDGAWTAPLLELLQGRREEIILRSNLHLVADAAAKALKVTGANKEDLKLVIDVIERKKDAPGTKIQMKPSFDKASGELEKMQLIIKWGGEFSHAARHQAKEYGLNMRRDMLIMNDSVLKNCTIYTSSERRVTASAEIFAAALLDDPEAPEQRTEPLHMVVRKDLLDDSNAAKDLTDLVKKKLKASLRPGASGAKADVPEDWPKDLPVPPELGLSIAELLSSLRKTMQDNYARLDVDRIQMRWCTHETPALFRERWEKLFADFEEDPHDPSRTSELYDMLSHDGLHNRTFLEKIFTSPDEPEGDRLDRLHDLYRKALALYLYVCPREYGMTPEEKEQIGLLTSTPLLNNILSDLRASEEARGMCSLYFTKESHIHTLLNLVFASDLPIVMPHMPPLDYFSSITFEVYERTSSYAGGDRQYGISASVPSSVGHSPTSSSFGATGNIGNGSVGQQGAPAGIQSTPASIHRGHQHGHHHHQVHQQKQHHQGPSSSANSQRGGSPSAGVKPERTLLITISEGAHSSNILSINLDARHTLAPLPRRPLTPHIDFDEAMRKLGTHTLRLGDMGDTDRGQIEGDAVYFGREETDHHLLPVTTKQRRGSLDTDQSSMRVTLQAALN
ncbi:hypothetical protein K437DRAFT_274814 [Tilletiaria anomala UBC 951]|uniref:Inositol hexakisphosphate and diphosphoinositol-pentakisphosphate kinase n=1 Tax=Tilletiaria anomala (strain ATCC 24038 / CBS 436.72 / UBC 951) TaxID=1037660 RepID=A0A066VU51_TILAU|nr:uncharacterized protein K437DRAFT_274814 [Tilletiaria anomala UBC 951]KDN43793.1 hypothetical protein K437DRAFT_274814 [Tilletiaria anomala UBC 951]